MGPLICQSCGFPFSEESRGTLLDDTRSNDYCINCMVGGKFTNPHLSLQDMQRKLIEMAKEHDEITLEEAKEILKILPDLKRWRLTHIL